MKRPVSVRARFARCSRARAISSRQVARASFKVAFLSEFEAAVWARRVSVRVVDGRRRLSGEHSAEPVPFDLRHVLRETS